MGRNLKLSIKVFVSVTRGWISAIIIFFNDSAFARIDRHLNVTINITLTSSETFLGLYNIITIENPFNPSNRRD